MLSWKWIAPVVIALSIMLAVNVSTPKSAEAEIDEIIAALCNGGEKVVPRGQVRDGSSFLRALQATGFIVSIVPDAPPPDTTTVTITFDFSVPNSKFIGSGVFDFEIPDGAGLGVTLILSEAPTPDPDFPAHDNCFNF